MSKIPNAITFAIVASAGSLTIGSFLRYLLGESLAIDFVNATRFGVIIGVLISTSMLGRNIQSLGLLLNAVFLGSRMSVQLYSEPKGPEPNPYYCLSAFGLWLFIIIYFGRKYSIDSDEWQLTIAALLHFVISTTVLVINS